MRNKMLYALLGVAAVIIIAMIVILLRFEQPFGTGRLAAENVGVPSPEITPPFYQPPSPFGGVATGDDSTPEGVVRQFIAHWAARDDAGMNQYVIDAFKDMTVLDLEYVESIDLIACQALSDDEVGELFGPEVYTSPFATAMVRADFTIHYNEAGREYFLTDSSQREGFLFWLVREKEGGDWRIAMQGY